MRASFSCIMYSLVGTEELYTHYRTLQMSATHFCQVHALQSGVESCARGGVGSKVQKLAQELKFGCDRQSL